MKKKKKRRRRRRKEKEKKISVESQRPLLSADQCITLLRMHFIKRARVKNTTMMETYREKL